jgi:hypothetical protein
MTDGDFVKKYELCIFNHLVKNLRIGEYRILERIWTKCKKQ